MDSVRGKSNQAKAKTAPTKNQAKTAFKTSKINKPKTTKQQQKIKGHIIKTYENNLKEYDEEKEYEIKQKQNEIKLKEQKRKIQEKKLKQKKKEQRKKERETRELEEIERADIISIIKERETTRKQLYIYINIYLKSNNYLTNLNKGLNIYYLFYEIIVNNFYNLLLEDEDEKDIMKKDLNVIMNKIYNNNYFKYKNNNENIFIQKIYNMIINQNFISENFKNSEKIEDMKEQDGILFFDYFINKEHEQFLRDYSYSINRFIEKGFKYYNMIINNILKNNTSKNKHILEKKITKEDNNELLKVSIINYLLEFLEVLKFFTEKEHPVIVFLNKKNIYDKIKTIINNSYEYIYNNERLYYNKKDFINFIDYLFKSLFEDDENLINNLLDELKKLINNNEDEPRKEHTEELKKNLLQLKYLKKIYKIFKDDIYILDDYLFYLMNINNKVFDNQLIYNNNFLSYRKFIIYNLHKRKNYFNYYTQLKKTEKKYDILRIENLLKEDEKPENKQMIRKAYIYKIYNTKNKKNKKVYIGSTTKEPQERLKQHKINYKSYKLNNGYKYYSLYKLIDEGDIKLEVIETLKNISKRELRIRENEHILNNNSINNNKAYNSLYDKIEYKKEYKYKRVYCYYCNKYITINNRRTHERTKKHIKNTMKTPEDIEEELNNEEENRKIINISNFENYEKILFKEFKAEHLENPDILKNRMKLKTPGINKIINKYKEETKNNILGKGEFTKYFENKDELFIYFKHLLKNKYIYDILYDVKGIINNNKINKKDKQIIIRDIKNLLTEKERNIFNFYFLYQIIIINKNYILDRLEMLTYKGGNKYVKKIKNDILNSFKENIKSRKQNINFYNILKFNNDIYDILKNVNFKRIKNNDLESDLMSLYIRNEDITKYNINDDLKNYNLKFYITIRGQPLSNYDYFKASIKSLFNASGELKFRGFFYRGIFNGDL